MAHSTPDCRCPRIYCRQRLTQDSATSMVRLEGRADALEGGSELKQWLINPDEEVRPTALRHPSSPHGCSHIFCTWVVHRVKTTAVISHGLEWHYECCSAWRSYVHPGRASWVAFFTTRAQRPQLPRTVACVLCPPRLCNSGFLDIPLWSHACTASARPWIELPL